MSVIQKQSIVKQEYWLIRWIWYVLGMMIFSLGLATMIKYPELGLEPWSAAHVALSHYAFSIGTWTAIIQTAFLCSIFFVSKRKIKPGTWCSLLLEGSLIDFYLHYITFPEINHKIAYFIGILMVSFGAAMLLRSHVGAGAKTQFYWVFSKYKQVSIWKMKALCEVIAIGIALLGHSHIGIGTFIYACLSGIFIQLLHHQLERFSHVRLFTYLQRSKARL